MTELQRNTFGLRVGGEICGFRVIRSAAVPEISATLFELEHEKSGANLIYLDRADNNMTFSVTFKTLPTDSTGVFHILEHSLLGGSEKFPVREPFVELMKSTLSTFLNAMTYADKTAYPVSSRSEKDLLNLMDVYLDGIFHPTAIRDPKIFRQEGWHYEIDRETGELSETGVVLNEMRGSYSSVDVQESTELLSMLFPDGVYSVDSGGIPSEIVKLSFDDFVAAYKKFYHPSNAFFFLDGSMQLEKELSLIDSYIREYDRVECDFPIPERPPITYTEKAVRYEIAENESSADKYRLSLAFPFVPFSDKTTERGMRILLDAIGSTAKSPLKKAILDSGLCEDFECYDLSGIRDSSLVVVFYNCKKQNIDRLQRLFFDTVRQIADGSVDKKLLRAVKASVDFSLRENDYGSYPAGILYAANVLNTQLYGGKPEDALVYREDMRFLAEQIDTDYYETLLRKYFLDCRDFVKLVMIPDKALAKKRKAEDKRRLAAIKASFTEEECHRLIEEQEELLRWQKTPDTEEALASLPTLTVDDLPTEPVFLPTEVSTRDGNEVIYHDVTTAGIVYQRLAFDASFVRQEELPLFSLLAEFLTNLPTEHYSAIDLAAELHLRSGAFSVNKASYRKGDGASLYLTVFASMTEGNLDEMLPFLDEVLLRTKYDDKESVRRLLRMIRLSLEDGFINGGHTLAIGRASAMLTADSAVKDALDGYEFYRYLLTLEKEYDDRADRLFADLSSLAKRIFQRENLHLDYAGKRQPAWEEKVLAIFPKGEEKTENARYLPLGKKNEGITTPADVTYAVTAFPLGEERIGRRGNLQVLRTILSLEHLWNKVRVQGGAYGAGFLSRRSGFCGSYSYRDPKPDASLACYEEIPAFIRAFVKDCPDLTRYIIAAVGDSDPLSTPKTIASSAFVAYFSGITNEERMTMQKQMIGTTKDDLLDLADRFEEAMKEAVTVVVGEKNKVTSAKDRLDVIYPMK